MARVLVAVSAWLALSACSAGARTVYKMDFEWKFQLATDFPPCPAGSFPIDMTGVRCFGLSQQSADSADKCQDACCGDPNCETWQWCPSNATQCTPPGSCWIGSRDDCTSGAEWESRGRTVSPSMHNCTVPECQPDLNDTLWRQVALPHDFVVEGTFTPTAEQGHGYLPKGRGWYRRHFTLPEDWRNDHVWIEFDGVYRNSDVYLNGLLLGHHDSGYTSFRYDVTDVPGVLYGEVNVLAVYVDATHDEGWWYEGGGIYRHVWLVHAGRTHIAPWGVYAYSTVTSTITDAVHGQVADARIQISTSIQNFHSGPRTALLTTTIINASGFPIGRATNAVSLGQDDTATLNQTIYVRQVALWHPDFPNLLTVMSSVDDAGGLNLDVVNTTIGVRKVVFSRDTGLSVNERAVKIKGLCNHQDFAGVGTAVPDRVNLFRVQKLKEMGANAWRMSHNPPNPELLDFTDREGMLVWDENRNFVNTSQYLVDLQQMILRDRNHPSIVIWSLCNEVGCQEGQHDEQALQTAQAFKSAILALDATRPISGAWNSDLGGLLNGWGPAVMDVQGINYNYGEFDPYHKQYPDKPLLSSETASCTCARGVYVTNNTIGHKDIYSCDGCAREWWTADATRPFVAGGFAWTGFDYKGEPTPYAWPEINSNFGILDIAGFPKDTFFYYQSWWTQQPVVHVFPHWNDPFGASGENLYIADCDSAQVAQHFVFASTPNGSSLRSADGLCVDGTCSRLHPNEGCYPLSLVPCTDSPAQIFTLTADGSIVNRGNGGCLDVYSDSGPQVGLYPCQHSDNQQWLWEPSTQRLRSKMPGYPCLADTQTVPVWVYTNAPVVELFVNGESVGRKAVPQLGNAQFAVAYSPGSLLAVAYDDEGDVVKTHRVVTTGPPAAVLLTIESSADGIFADGQDTALIAAAIIDADGNVVPTASNNITFAVSGPGSVLGVGNGDPSSHEPDKASWRSAFNGLARVLVQASTIPEPLIVTATASGLGGGAITVPVRVAPLETQGRPIV